MRPARLRLSSVLVTGSIAFALAIAGCATGTVDETGGGGLDDAGGVGMPDAHHDAPRPHDGSGGTADGNTPQPGMDSSTPPDMDSSMPPPPPDDGGVDGNMPPPVDANMPPPVDANMPPPVDANMPPPVDANMPPPVDANMPPPVDAGQDSGVVNCNPVTQTGCPNGDKCTLNGSTPPGLTCDPNGTVGNGGLCSGNPDNCAGPGLCVGGSTGPTSCRDFCNSDADCTQPPVNSGSTSEPNNKAYCLIGITSNGQSTPYKVCTYACNPVTHAGASGCPSGMECAYFWGITSPENVTEATDCEAAGTVGDGGDCTSATCKPGFTCVTNAANQNLCRQVCRNNGPVADCSNANDSCYPTANNNTMFGVCCDFFNGC
jgi:hypothetical protein